MHLAAVTGHSALRAPLEASLHALQRDARAVAGETPPREVFVLDVLKLAQDRLARMEALAPPGLLGERVEAFNNSGWQAATWHDRLLLAKIFMLRQKSKMRS
jgi:hypothetical protein